jgi:hypothetical protein
MRYAEAPPSRWGDGGSSSTGAQISVAESVFAP